jgi:hypothetical protein
MADPTIPQHGQVWQSLVNGNEYTVLRAAVQGRQPDDTFSESVLYMLTADVEHGVPGAALYCDTLVHFNEAFSYRRG